jgi:ubiquinone/menaquinone biosynthesis C-methylase UbiE
MTDAPTPADVARIFDDRAGSYDESAFHRALAERVVEFAGAATVDSVLDIATGTGLVLRAMPPSPNRRRAGVDVSAGMLDVARRRLPDAELVLQDAAAPLAFAPASFQLITCVTALHLLADPAAALRSWRPLLEPGGRVVVAAFRTDDATEVPAVAEALAHGAQRHPHSAQAHLHERIGTVARLTALAESAGYVVTRSETWVHPDPLEVCLLAELVPSNDVQVPRSSGA